ncbi:phage tail protein, partial [Escherichia coli]|nr:phage tail protein [Escherichia coli]
QLASLTAFIENNLPARARIPFTSDMDDITLVPFTKSLGHGQLCTQVRKYTAFLRWDAWPYRKLNPDLVFSLVEAWLADNG